MLRRTFVISPLAVVGGHAAQEARRGLSDKMTLHGVTMEQTEFKGKQAMRVVPAGGGAGEKMLALVGGFESFQDGTIEVEVAGAPGAGAMEGARGFIGVAFHVQPNADKFECFYLRPTNGRAEDQVRRNHSVQYISFPDFPWQRLRKEFPEKYESYADLEPAVWTHVKITVAGGKARLYVHGNPQPSLVVNDLKLGAVSGGIGLWVGPGTDGYFSGLKVTR